MNAEGRSPAAGRRGRRASPPDADAGPVGEFAHRLWELKQSAGDPSYARMQSEYGALASRSALAAAARGRRLPSWDTTWEFVRPLAVGVLDQPEERARRVWHARWNRARLAAGEHLQLAAADGHLRPDAGRAGSVDAEVLPTSAGEPGAPTVAAGPAGPPAGEKGAPPVHRPSGRRAWVLVLAASVVLLGGALAVAQGHRADGPPALPAPVVPGDAAEFVADVSVPDGTRIRPGDEVVKTWELRNAGGVAWDGRFLRRAESAGAGAVCTTLADRVPIAHTEPGGTARVSVVVRGLSREGQCQEFWKMVDGTDRLLLPGARPVYFVVRVVN